MYNKYVTYISKPHSQKLQALEKQNKFLTVHNKKKKNKKNKRST